MNLTSRHLLELEGMGRDELTLILDTAKSFREVLERPIKKVPPLQGKTIVNLFYENSTRTLISFELAETRLSGDVVNFSTSTSSVKKGETLKDTIRNIAAMKIDMVVVRHASAGVPQYLTQCTDAVIINAGDGSNEHPSQGLLDLYTILKAKGKIAGLKIAIVGDILHSRVVRSDLHSLGRMGARLWLCGPAPLVPREMERTGAVVTSDIREAVKEADVIIMLRIQLERQKTSYFPSLREYTRRFGLNRDVFSLAKDDAVIMHPGPINRGVEISDELADCDRSLVMRQVESGVAVRMALLYLLAGGSHVAH